MLPENIEGTAAKILEQCRAHRIRLATAESCTGGLLAAALTTIAGASDVFDRGFVTYSNLAKYEMLGVDINLIETFGAVSEEVAVAMAQGALDRSQADVAVSITGIAGPGGGTANKPVGLVHFACCRRSGAILRRKEMFGAIGRTAIRDLSVAAALEMIKQVLDSAGRQT